MDAAERQFELQKDLENYKNRLARGRLNDLALVIIRSLVLVNGGAVIAILAFMGNLWNRDGGTPEVIEFAGRMTYVLQYLVWGVVVALLSAVFAFIGQAVANYALAGQQDKASGQEDSRWANFFRGSGIFAGIISTGLFAYGALQAAEVFGTPPKAGDHATQTSTPPTPQIEPVSNSAEACFWG